MPPAWRLRRKPFGWMRLSTTWRRSGYLVLPQRIPAQALFIENPRNRYVVKRSTALSAQEAAMASRLLQLWLRTVEAIKGTGRMEGRSMLVLTMLIGFMLVGWVYSWVVALMLEDSRRL